MESFKPAAIKQTANWETEPVPWRAGCRFCGFANLKPKPITELKRESLETNHLQESWLQRHRI